MPWATTQPWANTFRAGRAGPSRAPHRGQVRMQDRLEVLPQPSGGRSLSVEGPGQQRAAQDGVHGARQAGGVERASQLPLGDGRVEKIAEGLARDVTLR